MQTFTCAHICKWYMFSAFVAVQKVGMGFDGFWHSHGSISCNRTLKLKNRSFFCPLKFHLEQDSAIKEPNQRTCKKYYIKENLNEIFTFWK